MAKTLYKNDYRFQTIYKCCFVFFTNDQIVRKRILMRTSKSIESIRRYRTAVTVKMHSRGKLRKKKKQRSDSDNVDGEKVHNTIIKQTPDRQ